MQYGILNEKPGWALPNYAVIVLAISRATRNGNVRSGVRGNRWENSDFTIWL